MYSPQGGTSEQRGASGEGRGPGCSGPSQGGKGTGRSSWSAVLCASLGTGSDEVLVGDFGLLGGDWTLGRPEQRPGCQRPGYLTR